MKKKSSQDVNFPERVSAIRSTSGRVDPAVLREASRVFDDELARTQQLAIAEEIVVTRAAELCLAYPNVLRVSFGYRRRKDQLKPKHNVIPEPCVRFLVYGKWAKRASKAKRGRIPPRLLSFCSIDGERRLCAVPTDVEDAGPHLLVRGEGARIIVDWGEGSESGVITCGIQRNTFPDRVYGLGCRHVLSLSEQFFDEATWGAQVHVESLSNPTILGPTLSIAGTLGPQNSFDAQLVEVNNLGVLRQALNAQEITEYAHSVNELPGNYNIIVPRGAIDAAFVDFIDQARYEVDGHDIGHSRLVQSQPETGTNRGDSGSPIVTKDGSRLLGMHIAGWAGLDSDNNYLAISYMIPAWELFKPSNYNNVDDGEIWTIMKP